MTLDHENDDQSFLTINQDVKAIQETGRSLYKLLGSQIKISKANKDNKTTQKTWKGTDRYEIIYLQIWMSYG